ncbi:BQ5605_C034g11332 [Microbotryum silenes-dioicae]|uniref:BQ5605_C034g11332 protein n=1 Tax=Microbotryum silenes-dioicae TaxID=796604 RepID=A0A2X0PB58_9BASI|nr:BQ5605_C034g11332 [Microbotryum silenes-dioicae]
MVLTGVGTLARGNTVGIIHLCHMASWHLNLSSQRDRSLIVRKAEDQPEAATQRGMTVFQVSSKHLHNARKEGGKDVNGMVLHKWSALYPIGALMVYSHWQYDSFTAFESDETTEQGPRKKKKADTKATFFTRARESEAASYKSEGELLREIAWFDPATIRLVVSNSSLSCSPLSIIPVELISFLGTPRQIRFLFGIKSNVALAPDARTIGECWTSSKWPPASSRQRPGIMLDSTSPGFSRKWVVDPTKSSDSDNAMTCAAIYMDPMPSPGVLALAGFKRDEPYVVPRLRIQAPEHLRRLVFPCLCEPNLASAIADTETHTALDGRQLDEATWRHLKLLFDVRSYLIVHLAGLYQRIPSIPLFINLPLFNTGHRDEREAFERPDLLAHVYDEDERRYRQHMESRFAQMLNIQSKLCEEFQAFSARPEPVAEQPRARRGPVSSTTQTGPNYRLPGTDAFHQRLTPTEIRKLGDTPAGDFDWRIFLEKVDVPKKLWPLYKPHQIGDYKSVEQMVLDWTAVHTVDHGHSELSEQLPPLSLLDEVLPQFDSEVTVVHKWIAQKSAEQAAGSSLDAFLFANLVRFVERPELLGNINLFKEDAPVEVACRGIAEFADLRRG